MKLIISTLVLYALFINRGKSKAMCSDWLDLVWSLMVLGEDRPATENDLKRIFAMMDMNVDDKVGYTEFGEVWKACTFMTEADTVAIFNMFASAGDAEDPSLITVPNVSDAWNQYFSTRPSVTKSEFAKAWNERIIPRLTNRGCGLQSPSTETGLSLLCLRFQGGGFF